MGYYGMTSSIEDKALELLGAGVPQVNVASALGVTESRISQLMAQTAFAEKVTELRFKNLQQHNKRDNKYDEIEDKLLHKLENSMSLLMRPTDILKALQTVNAAKRRGQSAPDQIVNQQTMVNIVLPSVITNKFAVNINNQVTKAGDQNLLTLSSGELRNKIEEKTNDALEGTPLSD